MAEIATHEEVLELLSEQARKGSVTAAAALERALRHRDEYHGDVGDEIDGILSRTPGQADRG
jgi:hypothetical protein